MKKDKSTWLRRKPEQKRAALLNVWAWVVSAVVLGLVVAMREIKLELPEGIGFGFLPPIYSTLNALAAVVLVAALLFIKQGCVRLHKMSIQLAMLLSILFLLLYVAYHITTAPTSYGGEGVLKIMYFFLLITHIILAAVSFPFILFAYISGSTNYFAKHRKLVKWVYPMWLYVAVTGPICYFMLKPYY